MKKLFPVRSMCMSALLACGLAAGTAQAGTVVSQIGVDDGLGLGIVSGEAFDFFWLPFGTGAGEWHDGGGFSTSMNSSWTGQLISAKLDIFSGGWGLDGQAEVYLNNVLIGLLTDGDLANRGDNYAVLDSFNLLNPLALLNANADNSFEIRTSGPDDAGVLGYARLVLETQDATGGTVPEPASMALAIAALGGAALTTRRRRRD